LRWLRFLPKAITSRRIVRRALTKLVKSRLNFKGYFDLYNIPFQHIHRYDFTEKKSPLQPRGMNRGPNIFDWLEEREIEYFVSDPNKTEEENRAALAADLRAGKIDFAFMYWAGLDGLLHSVGNDSPEIGPRLDQYEAWIKDLVRQSASRYDEVRLYVFSDHGMANCDRHVNLMGTIEALPLKFGEDYVAVYDSTMARFWFLKHGVREIIEDRLKKVVEGRIIDDAELKQLRAYFQDGQYGELIFLMDEGVLIVPSHMGERPIRAMHGYHPRDPQSYAALFTNQVVPESIQAIPHIYNLMTHEAEEAVRLNHAAPAQKPEKHHELLTV
jgi:predicted AlkP superfamily pyrophosphatase or phosphodiesterase